MSAPLVSVCLPNLNTRRFLQDRVDSIFSQTYPAWEMVVSDNHSTDGAWEFFEELASKDSRLSIKQAPREGMYANWNNCLRRARGEYVYIATSDDTMASDCLEKMVSALQEHPECDLAHCNLVTIDEQGEISTSRNWPAYTAFGQEELGLIDQLHVRRAPYDGMLHLTGLMVYSSITELLIRRSLFSRTGLFESRWGSHGDINWDMKAGLVANTIHVPDTWASWRIHPSQATAAGDYESIAFFEKVQEMIQDAVSTCEKYLPPAVSVGLRDYWLDSARDMLMYYRTLRSYQDRTFQKRLFQASRILVGGAAERRELLDRMKGKPRWPDRVAFEIRTWLESLGLGPVVTKVRDAA